MSTRISFWRYNTLRIMPMFFWLLVTTYLLVHVNIAMYYLADISLVVFVYEVTVFFGMGASALTLLLTLYNLYNYKTKRTDRWL